MNIFKISSTSILFLLSMLIFSQHLAGQVIDPKNVNPELINQFLYEKADSLRISNNTFWLKKDKALEQAAEDHAKFLSRRMGLTHFQRSRSKRTPQLRAFWYEAENILVAENLSKGYIYTELTDSSGTKKAYITDYKQLAELLFLSFKTDSLQNSRIISDEYDYFGLATAYSRRTNKVVAVMLLGKQTNATSLFDPDFTMPYHLHNKIGRKTWPRFKHWFNVKFRPVEFDYGIKYPPYRKDFYRWRRFTRRMDEMFTMQYNNKSYTYMGTKAKFDRLFTNPKDGLAIEYISGDFYNRPTDSLPKPGMITGALQKPIHLKELNEKSYFKREENSYSKYFYAYLGINADTLDKNSETNIFILKNNRIVDKYHMSHLCGNLVEYNTFPMFDYKPEMDKSTYTPKIPNDTLFFRFYYKTNEIIPYSGGFNSYLKFLEDTSFTVQKISFTSYASVEGTETINDSLFKARYDTLMKQTFARLDYQPLFYKNYDENWGMMWHQVEKSDLLQNHDLHHKDSVRKFINAHTNTTLIDSFLQKQRYSSVMLIKKDKPTPKVCNKIALSAYNKLAFKLNPFGPLNNKENEKKFEAVTNKLANIQLWVLNQITEGKMSYDTYAKTYYSYVTGEQTTFYYHILYNWIYRDLSENGFVMKMKMLELLAKKRYQFPVSAYTNYFTILIRNQYKNKPVRFTDIEEPGNLKHALKIMKKDPDIDRNLIKNLTIFYHFQQCREHYLEGNVQHEPIRNSLKYIYKITRNGYFSGNELRIARMMILFRAYGYAYKLIAPFVENAKKFDPDMYELYVKLHYAGVIPYSGEDYYQLLFEAREKLGKERWLQLFEGNCHINRQIFNYRPLHKFYFKEKFGE